MLNVPAHRPAFFTSSVPVVSLLVQTTSGASSVILSAVTITTLVLAVMDSDACTSAVLIPDTLSAPVSGSYSITAPSGNEICSASADADGAGKSSEKMPHSTKAVSSSPPSAKISTCSPTDGADQLRVRPARKFSQFSQSVRFPPVSTRHRPLTRSTALTVPMRIRLRSRRKMSC